MAEQYTFNNKDGSVLVQWWRKNEMFETQFSVRLSAQEVLSINDVVEKGKAYAIETGDQHA